MTPHNAGLGVCDDDDDGGVCGVVDGVILVVIHGTV